jgi:type III secretion protein J
MVKDSVEGLDDPNKVTVKFYTLSAPQVSRQGPDAGLALAAFSPLAIGILAGVLALLALAVAMVGRLRGRAAREAAQAADGRLWKG